MNQPLDPFSSQLGRLLDDAAAGYSPTPDVPRFERMLRTGGARRRGAVMVFSAAASVALIGGSAWAFLGTTGDDGRIAPAGSAQETEPTKTTDELLEPDPTEPKVTEPDHTEPKDTEPDHTEPKDTEPDGTEPKDTEPDHDEPTTSKPGEQDPPTTPKPTDPPNTEPPATEPPATEPPATEPPTEWPWSAHQTYGSCDASPPYDVFYGTAAPGAKIVIESAYSRTVGYANESGHWEIRVEFPESPYGEPFQVWVATNGHVDDFWFTRIG